MILSAQQEFSDSQAVTVLTGSTISTNVIDLGSPGTVLGGPTALTRDIGPGAPIPFRAWVETVFDSDEPGTLSVQIAISTTSTLASATVLVETDALIMSSLAAGYQVALSVLPDRITERYLGVIYEVTNTVTGGTMSSAIVAGVQKNTVPGRAPAP
tara:strand:- start:3591 stop:4058 length:468 start_codon:yes stop_codon:yes gene_type:complete